MLIKKLYNSLDNNQRYKITFIENIENFKLKFNKKIKLNGKYIMHGGTVQNNTYIYNEDKLNRLDKEIVEIDNNQYYYNVERYESFGDDDNLMIDIVSIKKKNYEDESEICGSIQIDKKLKIATILSLGNNIKCIRLKKGNDIYKNGDIVFQIMVDICKKEGIIQIHLTDNSYKKCGYNNLNLDILKTLTHGKTHYMKYGFKFKKRSEHNRFEYNKKILLSLPIIAKKELINLIMTSSCSQEKKKKLLKY